MICATCNNTVAASARHRKERLWQRGPGGLKLSVESYVS